MSAAPYIVTPKGLLKEYQRKFANDSARFKIGLWSRQTGKDFTSTAEVVEDSMTRAKNTWVIAAPSERQAMETLNKAKEWAEAYEFAIADVLEQREGGSGTLLKSTTIEFANKSRIVCVPGRPDTVRGFSANLLLTEFAFFEDPDATWRAVLPSITNPLRGGEKKVRLITTPNGKKGVLWKLWEKHFINGGKGVPEKSRWSCHKVTIHDAVRMGLPIDIEELRAAFDDPEGWAQEFECEFMDSSGVLLPYDMIALAESAMATEYADPALWFSRGRRLFCGIDFGRTNDPTVCWTVEQVGDLFVTREVLLLRDMPSDEQEQILALRIAAAQRTCFDYTGPGIGLGDYLVKKHGEYDAAAHKFGKIELCTFTAGFKREIFPKLRRAFEAPTRLRIPISVDVREDLHAMNQIVRNAEYTYAAPRTAEGHSDRCTALALCLRAAESPAVPGKFSTVRSGRAGRAGRALSNRRNRATEA